MRAHRDALDAIAEELLAHETVSGERVQALIAQRAPLALAA
jgi:cell division protease FtsH